MSAHTIMVVEDNPITRKMARVALEAEGFTVLPAPDGVTALDMAARAMPDLVLQDLVLPDIDGFTLIKRFRELPGGSDTPVLAFTGFVSKVEGAHVSAAGFDGALIKPVEPSRLVVAVREFLSRKKSPVAPQGDAKRVLLVDDDPILLKLHKVQLQQLGLKVSTATDGVDALAKARHHLPDVILSDILMPRMDGFHLAAAVRMDARLSGVPVVLISGNYVEEVDRDMAKRAGAQEILLRTPHFEDAAEALRSVIERGVPPAEQGAGASIEDTEYMSRIVQQLERQATLNMGLAQRASLQAAALSVLAAIAETLTTRSNTEPALEEVLSQCVDAAGLSRGAILTCEPGGTWRCAARIGFSGDRLEDVAVEFAGGGSLANLLARGTPFTVAPLLETFPRAPELLARLGASSAMVAPIKSPAGTLGALLFASATRTLAGDEWRAFAQTIASQLGQAIELAHAFDALSSSEARYRTLFETVNLIALVLDERGHVEYVNSYFLRLGGYAREEVIGHEWFEFLPSARRPELKGVFADLLEHGMHPHFENAIVTKSGEERMIAWHNTTIRATTGRPAGTLSMGEDITERNRANAALKESQQRFSQIANNVQEAFFITDYRTGLCQYVSPAYERIWGRTAESAYVKPFAFADAMHLDDRPEVEAIFRKPLDPAGTTTVTRLIRPDKSERVVRSRVFPVYDENGAVAQIVGVAEDITELRQAEQQLLHSQKMEVVGQLAGGIAHDFNNLLQAISVFADLAQAGLDADDQRSDDMAQVQAAVQQATRLTRQLLAFSRQQVLHPEVLDLNATVGNVSKMITRLLGEDVDFLTSPDTLVGPIYADAGQIEQILLNLVVNARDAMPDGGHLTIETHAAMLDKASAAEHGLDHPGEYAVLVVQDSGTGMPPEVAARVFEPFFTTKGAKGTGLGLATVYGIVKQSGGNVAVSSTPGAGTIFTIHLPVTKEQPKKKAGGAQPDTTGGAETILIAEDEAPVRQAFIATLERLGYTVIAGNTAEQALALAERHEGPIHLVLSDVVMPGMHGLDLVTHLRKRMPGIRVLLTSGYAGGPISRRGVMESGLPFLQKPFASAALAQKVREVLDAAP